MTLRLFTKFQSLPTKHLCLSFQLLPSNFNFMEHFKVIILKKKITSREHLRFFIVNSKQKGMAGEISLPKDLSDMKACNKH